MAGTADLIKGFESFRPTAYWDVNHWRVGYGSDTVTDPDGTVHPVTQSTTTTEADADRDLDRRIAQTQAGIISTVGQDSWDKLTPAAQAGVTSLAYNYGSLSGLRSLQRAIQTGDSNAVAAAILARSDDNDRINADRRTAEAAYITGHPIPPADIPAAPNSSGSPDDRSLFAASGTAMPAPSPAFRNTLGRVNEYDPLPAPAPLVAAVGLGRPGNQQAVAQPVAMRPSAPPSGAIRSAVGLAGAAAPAQAPPPAPAPSQATRPASSSGTQTGVTTITVRPDGSTSSNEGGMAGSSSLPPNVRPNVPVIADSPSSVSTNIPKYITTTERVAVAAPGSPANSVGAAVGTGNKSGGLPGVAAMVGGAASGIRDNSRDVTHAAQQAADSVKYKTVTRTVLNPQWIKAQQAPVKVAPVPAAVGIRPAPTPAPAPVAAPGVTFLADRGINVANAPLPVQANALRDQMSGSHGEGHFGV